LVGGCWCAAAFVLALVERSEEGPIIVLRHVSAVALSRLECTGATPRVGDTGGDDTGQK